MLLLMISFLADWVEIAEDRAGSGMGEERPWVTWQVAWTAAMIDRLMLVVLLVTRGCTHLLGSWSIACPSYMLVPPQSSVTYLLGSRSIACLIMIITKGGSGAAANLSNQRGSMHCSG
jgi:hypothetical protein